MYDLRICTLPNTKHFVAEKCTMLDKEKMELTYQGLMCFNSYQASSSCTADECQMAGMLRSRKRDINCDLCPNFQVNFQCFGSKGAGKGLFI